MSIGKMNKFKEMLKHPALRPHLPETYWLDKVNIVRMLKNCRCVFIKPDRGSGGSGIIRVTRLGGTVELVYGTKQKIVKPDSVMKVIKSSRKKKGRYLVQRGIELARYNGAPFDVRIYMQKPKSKWIISGMSARVAAPNQFVTNYLKGGHAEPLPKVLSSLYPKDKKKVKKIIKKMGKLSKIIAEALDRKYPIRELGNDLAIDSKGRIWIIEANSKPGHMLFTELPDKTMLRTIMKNKRHIKKIKPDY